MISVEIVYNRFPEMTKRGIAAAEEAKYAAIRAIADAARDRVPVLTGETRDSIMELEDGVEVGGASLYLEFGTRKMSARPFFTQGVVDGENAADGVLDITFR
jgi:hypothetical protein